MKKDGEPGDPAVRVERSGHDVVKKASELEVEKKASGGQGTKQDDGVAKNEEGKDVAAEGKPDAETKEAHAEKKGTLLSSGSDWTTRHIKALFKTRKLAWSTSLLISLWGS